LAEAFLRSNQRTGQFLDLSRSRLGPFRFGSIIDEQPLLRRYPVIQGSNALAIEMLDGDIGDAQRDDPH
jgi:hypothetical protein